MTREEIVRLVIWTMQYYGSDAGERQVKGSKLRSQAEHIADVIAERDELQMRCNDVIQNFAIVLTKHNVD